MCHCKSDIPVSVIRYNGKYVKKTPPHGNWGVLMRFREWEGNHPLPVRHCPLELKVWAGLGWAGLGVYTL